MENRFMKVACLTVLMIGNGLQAMDPGYASPGAVAGKSNDLVNAAGSGDIARVKELLNDFTKRGFGGAYSGGLKRIEIGNIYGETALMHAAGSGHKEVCKLLIAHGANVNTRDWNGNTALIFAAVNDHREVCELLIAADADVNATNKFDKTALMYAIENGHRDVSRILLAGKLNKMDLDAALHYGVMPSLQSRLNDRLYNAAVEGHIAKVKELIAVGADVNATDRQGQTALIKAGNEGHIAKVKELIAVGADVNATDRQGQTALIKAGNKEVAKFLIDAMLRQRTQEQKSAEKALFDVMIKKHSGKDVARLTTEELIKSQQGQNYQGNKANVRNQIMRIGNETLRQELLDYLNSK